MTVAAAHATQRRRAAGAPALLLQVLVALIFTYGAYAKPKPQDGGSSGALAGHQGDGYSDFFAHQPQTLQPQQQQPQLQHLQPLPQFGGGFGSGGAGGGAHLGAGVGGGPGAAGVTNHFGAFPSFQSQPFSGAFGFGGGGLGAGGVGAAHGGAGAGSAVAGSGVDPGAALQPLQHGGGAAFPQHHFGQFSGFSQSFGPVTQQHYTDLTGHGAGGADAVKGPLGGGAGLGGAGLGHAGGVGGASGLGLGGGPVVGFYGGGPGSALSFGGGAGFGGPAGSFPGFASGGGVGGFPALRGGPASSAGAAATLHGGSAAAPARDADRDGPRADGDAPDDNH